MNRIWSAHMQYVVASPEDLKWGIAVTCAGSQEVGSGESYPPSNHPNNYLFSKFQGRILNEYQLLYISKGQGTFLCESLPRRIQLSEGSMIFLFPGEWHSYWPNPDVGWEEYWIGFKGEHMKMWENKGFFNRTDPVWNLGLKNDIISQYRDAIETVTRQGPCYQQRLGGIVTHILGLARYYNQNAIFADNAEKMERAKLIITDQFRTITPVELANQLCMSYSNFRRVFKDYTGFSPAKYIQQVRLNYMKEALTYSSMSVAQIAYDMGYKDAGYIFSCFREEEGMTPMEYRQLARSIKR